MYVFLEFTTDIGISIHHHRRGSWNSSWILFCNHSLYVRMICKVTFYIICYTKSKKNATRPIPHPNFPNGWHPLASFPTGTRRWAEICTATFYKLISFMYIFSHKLEQTILLFQIFFMCGFLNMFFFLYKSIMMCYS